MRKENRDCMLISSSYKGNINFMIYFLWTAVLHIVPVKNLLCVETWPSCINLGFNNCLWLNRHVRWVCSNHDPEQPVFTKPAWFLSLCRLSGIYCVTRFTTAHIMVHSAAPLIKEATFTPSFLFLTSFFLLLFLFYIPRLFVTNEGLLVSFILGNKWQRLSLSWKRSAL